MAVLGEYDKLSKIRRMDDKGPEFPSSNLGSDEPHEQMGVGANLISAARAQETHDT